MKPCAQPVSFLLPALATWSRVALATALLGLCSCSSLRGQNAASNEDPFLENSVASRSSSTRQAARPASSAAARHAAAMRQAMKDRVQQTGFEQPGRSSPSAAVQQTRAEARVTLTCPVCPEGCGEDGGYYPDEYLCDGGDRDLPVHYDQDLMRGLETEDTVVEYVDEEGKRRVRPSRKVCIYAPRFASVVSISAPLEDIGGGRPNEAVLHTQGVGLNSRQVSVAQEQREATERLVVRARGSALVTDLGSDAVDRPTALHTNEHTTIVLENYAFLRTGEMIRSEGAWLAKRAQAAVVWTRDQSPVIAAHDDSAQELNSRFDVAELTGQENRYQGKSRLRIVKLADRDLAKPGDVVTFTIRFDNIGDQAVRKVVIVDNLTPRLEYVEDSGTLDRDGRLFTDDNGEGSLILRWELDEPLAGRTGGVATFQARVR